MIDRLSISGDASSCLDSPKATPTLLNAPFPFAYDSFGPFTNTNSASGVCATVEWSPGTCAAVDPIAYSTFDPNDQRSGYLGDLGIGTSTPSFSFDLPAGESFILIVQQAVSGPDLGCEYTLRVDLEDC